MKSHAKSRLNLLLVGILVLVIAISGCTGDGGKTKLFGYGKDSLKIAIDTEGRNTFDSLQPFIVTVTAENVGSFDVYNVTSRLQGYDGITSTETPKVVLSAERDTSPHATLERPQPDVKVSGGTATADWDAAAPYLPVDAPDREIILTGEVIYATKSTASQRVVAATRTHVENLEAKGEPVPAMPETDAVNGPVAVDVEIPVPYVKVIGQKNEFPVRISLNNDGTGTVWNRDIDYDYLTRIIMKIPLGAAIADEANCDFKLLGSPDIGIEKTAIIDFSKNRQKLRLLEGGVTRELNCRLYVDNDYVVGYNTFDIGFEAYYTYIQSVSKRLLIQGTEEAPVKVRILDPTSANPDDWIRSTTHTVKFEVLYQNLPVTSGLTVDDVIVNLGGTAAEKTGATPLEFNSDDETWEIDVITPDMGTAEAAFDLTVDVNYQAESGSDIEKDAIKYSPTLTPP